MGSAVFNPFAFLAQLLNLLLILIIIRIVVSWVAPHASPYQQPYRLLYSVTEPVMSPFRAIIPPIGGLDLSPMLLFILIQILIGVFSGLA